MKRLACAAAALQALHIPPGVVRLLFKTLKTKRWVLNRTTSCAVYDHSGLTPCLRHQLLTPGAQSAVVACCAL
jgi:hypothetical protein